WNSPKVNFEHLKDLPLQDIGGGPDILIGQDLVKKPLETRNGGPGEPYAVKTILGWVARGPCGNTQPEQGNFNFFWTNNRSFGTESPEKGQTKENEERTLQQIKDKIVDQKNGEGYVASLPWKKDAPTLTNNLREAEKRLQSTLQKCERDPKYSHDYQVAMDKYLSQGYSEVIYEYDAKDAPVPGDPRLNEAQHFLPHHRVYKNETKEKLQIVFDSSAKSNGVSLNACLQAGPIRLAENDAMKHRCLWKGKEKDIAVFQMNSLTFGDGPSSPCIAITALQKTAEEHGSNQINVIETIMNGFYMDNLEDSMPTIEEANRKSIAIKETLTKGNFELTWRSQERNLCVGDVVLVVDNNLPRGEWRWGYISEVYPGMGGLVRKAKVRSPKGAFLR
ncbi:hypothetical protein TCAL_13176, partial [Tigriopus californicus]